MAKEVCWLKPRPNLAAKRRVAIKGAYSKVKIVEDRIMNRMEREKGEAKLRFLDGDFEVLQPGAYVVCAVTGAQIPLDALRYWSVDLQEAYASPAIATKRMQEKGLVP